MYLPGIGGLNSGVQPPPGLSYANISSRYSASTFRGPNGESLPVNVTYTVAAVQNMFMFIAPMKVLKANYGATMDVIVARGSVTLERFDVSSNATGIGDLYIEPVGLGWHFKRVDARFAYGFGPPTGAQDVTSDFFGNFLTGATTIYFDDKKLSQISLNSVTEFHGRKQSVDLRVGNNTTLEFAAGQAFVSRDMKRIWQMGLVGYGEWQLTRDAGRATLAALAGRKDRVYALGGEANLILTKVETSIGVRPEWEFGARNRGEGWIMNVILTRTFPLRVHGSVR